MWLHIPTSLSSPASACSTSDSTSLYQALAASVTVSGKGRRPRYWRRAWQKANWTKRLSTPTCHPSQSDRIVAAWLESLAVSPAKTSALPADKQASTATGAGCSSRSSDLFASWDQSSGCFSKTSLQSSLFPQELPYSENLPRSGSMVNGQLYARPTVARRIGGIERSSLPIETDWRTPNTRDHHAGGPRLHHAQRQTQLVDQVSHWPTPAANDDNKSPEAYRHMREHKLGRKGKAAETISSLNVLVQTWPTPRGTDGAKGGPNQAGSRGDLMLPSAAAMWSTPNARDDHNPSQPDSERTKRKLAQGWTIDLNEQAAWWSASSVDTSSMRTAYDTVAQTVKESAWPTPKARDSKSAEGPAGMNGQSPDLNVVACHSFHPDLPTPQLGPQSSQIGQTSRRRLNPAFVEWLMGLPIGYTASGRLGTEWSRYRQQLHSAYSRIVRKFSNEEDGK